MKSPFGRIQEEARVKVSATNNGTKVSIEGVATQAVRGQLDQVIDELENGVPRSLASGGKQSKRVPGGPYEKSRVVLEDPGNVLTEFESATAKVRLYRQSVDRSADEADSES